MDLIRQCPDAVSREGEAVVSPPFPKSEALVRLNCVTLFLSKSYQLAAPPLSPASTPRLAATPHCAPPPLLSAIPIDWQERLPMVFGGLTCCLLPPLVVDRSRCCWPPLSLLDASAPVDCSRCTPMSSSTILQPLSHPLASNCLYPTSPLRAVPHPRYDAALRQRFRLLMHSLQPPFLNSRCLNTASAKGSSFPVYTCSLTP